MSSLIEQAAQRLEQLRTAGADIPDGVPIAQANKEALNAPSGAQSNSLSRRVEIDLEALSKAGIVSPNAPRSAIADQFRVVKRPLIGNAMGKGASPIINGNLIMVTSSLPGEGKTFTAINLAMSMATELDYTVMLVDADVARPSVMTVLGLPAGAGLLDLVLDESMDLSSMLLKTNVDKLTLLPSGTPHPRATELLASDAMINLLNDMARRYTDRIIIFDSPPLLLATEARVLASHMGQIVMVVQAERTLQSDVVLALSTIDACPVKLMLLNQARTVSKGGYEYGYGHVYGYEYGFEVQQA
ncbi:MAG: protein tyrosine kinase [Burkholderiales bacterium RIFCSPLOWO2_12_FULL_61_40]|nr:MAG: protein tyrosine kinase [Burkholderiales bacterium RIFCSPLOWO2_12_FULL_61_40]